MINDYLLLEVKSLLVGHINNAKNEGNIIRSDNDDDFVCHPSLLPHFVHVLDKFPTVGSAKKLDRKSMIKIAQDRMLLKSEKGMLISMKDSNSSQDRKRNKEVLDYDLHRLICSVFSNVLGIIINDNITNNNNFSLK